MKKHLLLQGNIQIGKSTLIKNAISPYIQNVGGFFVQRIFVGQRHMGFSINPLKEIYDVNRVVEDIEKIEHMFLSKTSEGKLKIDKEVFKDNVFYALKKGTKGKKLIVLDEIGGVELNWPDFMKVLFDVVDGDIPILGVLKAPKSMNNMNTRIENSAEKVKEMHPSYKRIEEHSDIKILNIDKENYMQVKNQVEEFVRAIMK
ncbi:hypothetical protein IZY60_05155 [Lutibacter sp. B2]|nr:hypothetical protein [Lutibacter sp. B2]